MNSPPLEVKVPKIAIDVVEPGRRARRGRTACVIDRDLKFSAQALQDYVFADKGPMVYDALLVAATVEFADRSAKRWQNIWTRQFSLRIPVHDPSKWNATPVHSALTAALGFLAGDIWSMEFVAGSQPIPQNTEPPT